MRSNRGPRLMGNGSEILSDADTARVRRLVVALGVRTAMRRLGVSENTLGQARGFGRISIPTIAKLLEALTREEAANVM